MRTRGTVHRLGLAFLAGGLAWGGAAQAAPSSGPLKLVDPVGDVRLGGAASDIVALTVDTKRSNSNPVLVLRLDLAAAVTSSDALYEVVFRASDCTIRMAYAPRPAVQQQAGLGSAAGTYDCGPGSETALGSEFVNGDVVAAGKTITWRIPPMLRGVRPGVQLSAFRAYTSTTDASQQVWAANTAGVAAHDALTSTAVYQHR